MKLLLAVTMGVLAAGLSVPAAAATPAWTIAVAPVPSGVNRAQSEDVSCPSANVCFQVGVATRPSVLPLVDVHEGGRVSTEMLPLPSDADRTGPYSAVYAIDCVSGSSCVAVGVYQASDNRFRPLIETYRGGAWYPSAAPWPKGNGSQPQLLDVACNTTMCVATGSLVGGGDGMTTGFVDVRHSTGTWTNPDLIDPLPDMYVRSPVCAPQGPCYAEGDGFDFDLGHNVTRLLHPSRAGWVGTDFPTPARGDPNTLRVGSMACPSQDYCAGVAGYRDSRGRNHLAAELLTFGRLAAREIAISARLAAHSGILTPGPTACGSLSAGLPCAAAAYFYLSDASDAVLVRSSGGRWHVARAPLPADGDLGTVNIHDVSCPDRGRCVAVGEYDVDRRARPLAEEWNGSGWVATGLPIPDGASRASLTAVSCAPSGLCLAGGNSAVPLFARHAR